MALLPARERLYGRPDAFLDRCDGIIAAVLETLRDEVAQTGATLPEQVAYMGIILPALCARYAAVLTPSDRERFLQLVRQVGEAAAEGGR